MRDTILGLPQGSAPLQSFIVHGGGKLDGVTQSNSYEAVMSSISLGCRLIELDLIETTDGRFVASHDWMRLRKDINYPEKLTNDSLSYADVINSKILGKYHVVTIEDIKALLRIHSEIYIFTDQTTNYSLINSIGYADRFFVETFNIFNYLSALHHGIRRPLLNLDSGKFGVLLPLISYFLTNPKHVTFSMKTVERYPWLLRLLASRNVNIYIFTVNDPSVAQRYILDYRAIIYSDDLLEACR
jgi:glycerophosphoryl diester phosphodiesterase